MAILPSESFQFGAFIQPALYIYGIPNVDENKYLAVSFTPYKNLVISGVTNVLEGYLFGTTSNFLTGIRNFVGSPTTWIGSIMQVFDGTQSEIYRTNYFPNNFSLLSGIPYCLHLNQENSDNANDTVYFDIASKVDVPNIIPYKSIVDSSLETHLSYEGSIWTAQSGAIFFRLIESNGNSFGQIYLYGRPDWIYEG